MLSREARERKDASSTAPAPALSVGRQRAMLGLSRIAATNVTGDTSGARRTEDEGAGRTGHTLAKKQLLVKSRHHRWQKNASCPSSPPARTSVARRLPSAADAAALQARLPRGPAAGGQGGQSAIAR